MKNLIEIAAIVTKKKVRKIEIFDDHNLKQKNSKFNEFYEALLASRYKNDRDAAADLYQCSPQDPRYRQLKSRFRRRLLNTLFFLDINRPSASSYDRAYFTAHKEWTLIKILQDNNAHMAADNLARGVLTMALKYHLTDIIVNCARILRQYAAEQDQPKDFEHYNQLVNDYGKLLFAELRAEELYQTIISLYWAGPRAADEAYEQLHQHTQELLQLAEWHQSPQVNYYAFLAWAVRFELSRDYESVIEVCEKAEHFIQSNPDYYQEEKLVAFYTKKMLAYLHLRDFRRGQSSAEQYLKEFAAGSSVWYDFMEYYLLLALHTEHFFPALAIYNRAATQAKFRKLGAVEREKWRIYEGYLYYFLKPLGYAGKIHQAAKRTPFAPEKFIQQKLDYNKEWRIFTLLGYFLQVLLAADNRQFNVMSERIDHLRNMANRQLDKEHYFRPIQFIRLLQQLRRADYRTEELHKPKKYLNSLQSEPFTYRGLLYQLEPVPYEFLWETLLKRLKAAN